MARPRTGHLELRGGVWHCRVTVGEGEKKHREFYGLGTADKALAKRKMHRLLLDIEDGKFPTDDGPGGGGAVKSERVDDYTEAWFDKRIARKVSRVVGERIYYRNWIKKSIGDLYLCDVRPQHVRAIVDKAIEGGLARETVVQIRGLLHNVLRSAWREELIENNPVDRVEVPKVHAVTKQRCILTDAEFCAFMASDKAQLEIKLMSLVARTLGGMRKSDVVRWDWSMVTDREEFTEAIIPRSKTGKPEPLEVPELLRPFLKARWEAMNKPHAGPVFPVECGPRAGQPRKLECMSGLAKRLRRNLLAAGVVRVPYTEVRVQQRYSRSKKTHEVVRRIASPHDPLYFETATTLPVDFHSFRRAYSTALAACGVNVQQAMHLAGHSSPRAHMRYVQNTKAMGRVPSAAIPQLPVAFRGNSIEDSQKQAGTDSNIGSDQGDVSSQKQADSGYYVGVDTVGVGGSKPLAPTKKTDGSDTVADPKATGSGKTPPRRVLLDAARVALERAIEDGDTEAARIAHETIGRLLGGAGDACAVVDLAAARRERS